MDESLAMSKDLLWKHIRTNLRILAANPKEQEAALMPGCPMCDLYDDLEVVLRFLDERNFGAVEDEVVEALRNLLEIVFVAAEDHECFENDDLYLEKWNPIRSHARELMNRFGIDEKQIEGFQPQGDGVWHKSLDED